MATLARAIGLGLAARGDIEDVVRWARQARDGGLDSIWIHDSYFERDAITFGAAVAGAIAADGPGQFRVALGAVNPNTRHPVVLAMTGSALDELLPGRIVMGLGTGLPLRLKQMGIPYEPEAALARLSSAFDEIRALWAGERLPSGTPGLPPIQPMFPPTHRIPLFLAAYRRDLVALAGQKADGYLARPAESIPSLRGILARLDHAATGAGRDPRSIERAGYLLSLVDETRREALNRAKREPFVIYMMSILGDVSLQRAGFERDLRDRIAAAWRAEDYHTAGNLIPDDLLDAFMLCGTREDVAQRAMAFHLEAGLELPLLQPVLQEDHQIDELVAAAALYARSSAREEIGAHVKATLPPVTPTVDLGAALADHERAKDAGSAAFLEESGAHPKATLPPVTPTVDIGAAVAGHAAAGAARSGGGTAGGGPAGSAGTPGGASAGAGSLADDRTLGRGSWLRRRIGALWEILRPFAYTASVIPVVAAAALAAVDGRFEALPFLRCVGRGGPSALRHEHRQRDLRRAPGHRHDHLAPGQPRPVEGSIDRAGRVHDRLRRVRARDRGRAVSRRAPRAGDHRARRHRAGRRLRVHRPALPVQVPRPGRADRVPADGPADGGRQLFRDHRPLGDAGTRAVDPRRTAGGGDPRRQRVARHLRGHPGRDRDAFQPDRPGVGPLRLHRARPRAPTSRWASRSCSTCLPPATALAVLSLPFLAQVIRSAELGASGQARAIAMIDLQTARLHLAFGALLVAGILLSGVLRA